WRARAIAQLAACLVAQGRQAELPALLERHAESPGEPFVRFYLALLSAQELKMEEAVAHLRKMLAAKSDDQQLRGLAFRVLLRYAQAKLKQSEWQAASQALGEAVKSCPQDPRALRELENFRGALPLAHVHSGNRAAAAKVWEDDLRKEPSDCKAIHHLALMFYWWAMDLESNGGPAEAEAAAETPESIRRKFVFRGGQFVKAAEDESKGAPLAVHPADQVWDGAIAYWTLLAGHESFWSHWRQAQQESCGCALQDADVETLKEKIIDEHLAKTIQDFASRYQGEKKDEDAARHDRYLTALAMERKSAELWARACGLLRQLQGQSSGLPILPLLELPGGYLFFQRLGLLPEIYQRVEALSLHFEDDPLVPELQIYFSPAGYGRIAALIEDRKKPREAMELLEQLGEEHRERPEFIYLSCRAQLEQGSLLLAKESLQAALTVWEGAWNTLKKTLRSGGLAVSFKKLLQSTRDAIGDAVFHACQKEAGKLKAQEKFEEAIAVLQMGFELTKRNDVKELLCIFYCDRGDRLLNDKKFKEARKDFESALAADPENARAKKSFGQTYVVEGLEYGADNLQKAIELFEKAIKYMGEDSTAGELMAQACNARAVEILNNMNQYTPMSSFDESIRLLRRAIKLLNPKIKDATLDTMVDHESVDAIEEATKDMKEDTYKKALQNLALAGRFKRQKRAGELNSQAVSILNSLTQYSSSWEVDRAIEMLEEAARIVGPQNAGTILSNLQTAYNLRRQLRGW
ncbi:MAG TPA: hypothetical protein VNL38_00995, partial [Candidatus Nitrosotenuis sp.]|nr:hypothetical protein [Candidatus Nitrosotenuis sp.]